MIKNKNFRILDITSLPLDLDGRTNGDDSDQGT